MNKFAAYQTLADIAELLMDLKDPSHAAIKAAVEEIRQGYALTQDEQQKRIDYQSLISQKDDLLGVLDKRAEELRVAGDDLDERATAVKDGEEALQEAKDAAIKAMKAAKDAQKIADDKEQALLNREAALENSLVAVKTREDKVEARETAVTLRENVFTQAASMVATGSA